MVKGRSKLGQRYVDATQRDSPPKNARQHDSMRLRAARSSSWAGARSGLGRILAGALGPSRHHLGVSFLRCSYWAGEVRSRRLVKTRLSRAPGAARRIHCARPSPRVVPVPVHRWYEGTRPTAVIPRVGEGPRTLPRSPPRSRAPTRQNTLTNAIQRHYAPLSATSGVLSPRSGDEWRSVALNRIGLILL